MKLSDLAGRYQGKTICVMGGAPCLMEDLKGINADVYISANHHGCLVRECDFIVAVDSYHLVTKEYMGDILKPYNTPIISSRYFADYRIPDFWSLGFSGNSGMLGIVVAGILGAKLVVTAGIELYQGQTYFHSPDEDNPAFKASKGSTEKRLAMLANIIQKMNVRKMSGPMPYPLYDPNEVFDKGFTPAELKYFKSKKLYEYRCINDFEWHTENFTRNQIINITTVEAQAMGVKRVQRFTGGRR